MVLHRHCCRGVSACSTDHDPFGEQARPASRSWTSASRYGRWRRSGHPYQARRRRPGNYRQTIGATLSIATRHQTNRRRVTVGFHRHGPIGIPFGFHEPLKDRLVDRRVGITPPHHQRALTLELDEISRAVLVDLLAITMRPIDISEQHEPLDHQPEIVVLEPRRLIQELTDELPEPIRTGVAHPRGIVSALADRERPIDSASPTSGNASSTAPTASVPDTRHATNPTPREPKTQPTGNHHTATSHDVELPQQHRPLSLQTPRSTSSRRNRASSAPSSNPSTSATNSENMPPSCAQGCTHPGDGRYRSGCWPAITGARHR